MREQDFARQGMDKEDLALDLCARCWPAWKMPDTSTLGHYVEQRELEMLPEYGRFAVSVLDVTDGVRFRYSGDVHFDLPVHTYVRGTLDPHRDFGELIDTIEFASISVEVLGDNRLTRARTRWAASRDATLIVGAIVRGARSGEHRSRAEIERTMEWYVPRRPRERKKLVDDQYRRIGEIVRATPYGWNTLVAEDPEVLRLGNRRGVPYSPAHARFLKGRAALAGVSMEP